MNLILYNHARSSSYGVRIALAPKGLAYEYVAVDLLAGEQQTDAHKGDSDVPAMSRHPAAHPFWVA